MADHLFDPWCSGEEVVKAAKTLRVLRGKTSAQAKAIEIIQGVVPTHYCKPEIVRKWLKKWGYKQTLAVVKKDLPMGKKARSGDIGEILATEYVNRKLDFNVPIFRLRWRDHRELALRGDDLLAIQFDAQGRIHFMKGEAKSRQSLSAAVVEEASEALHAHDGRPGPHTINYVVKRLYELGEDELAEKIEDYLSRKTIPRKRVTHLLFALCGNDPKPHLESYLISYTGPIQQVIVGLRVNDHGSFVKTIFDGVQLA